MEVGDSLVVQEDYLRSMFSATVMGHACPGVIFKVKESPEMDGQTLREGTKKDEGKPRWDLFPWDAAEQVVKVLNFGATKYEDRNWEKGIKYGRVFGALIRHSYAWFMSKVIGTDGRDPETGLSHLAHAACCVMFLLSYELRGMSDYDDRPGAQARGSKSTQ